MDVYVRYFPCCLRWFGCGKRALLRIRPTRLELILLICYSTPILQEGGCTYFPVIDKRFEPKKGTAAVWYNRDVNGNMVCGVRRIRAHAPR